MACNVGCKESAPCATEEKITGYRKEVFCDG